MPLEVEPFPISPKLEYGMRTKHMHMRIFKTLYEGPRLNSKFMHVFMQSKLLLQ